MQPRTTPIFARLSVTLLATISWSAVAAAQPAAADMAAAADTAAPAAETAAADAAAARASGLGLEDIVVTAERRPESLQTVPVATTAFTADQLSAKGITSTLALVSYVPNMVGSNTIGLGSANAYYLRGLGSTETIPTFDPPVGTFVDDVYIAGQNANNFGFFDLERIEVLRGPQTTLFGRNTTAGVISVVLKKPADSFGGYAELSYGSYEKWLGRASIDLPLGENFGVKLSGYYQTDDGYAYNALTDEHVNDTDAAGIRGALRLAVGEHIAWNAAIAYTQDKSENLVNFKCDPANPANCNGRYSSTGLLTDWPAGGTYNPYAPATVTGEKAGFPLGNVTDTVMLTSNLQWIGDTATLSLITGVVNTSQDYALDFADGRGFPGLLVPDPVVHGYPSGGYTIANQGQFDSFAQEVKLNGALWDGRINYVVGALFFHENNTSDVADIVNAGPALGIAGNAGLPVVLADRTLRNTTDASAGYGQFDFLATDRLTLTAGVRYTAETRTFSVSDNRAQCTVAAPPLTCLGGASLVANGVAIPTEQTTHQWAPKFVATWLHNDAMMFYASATNGAGSGGWNARGTTGATLLPFEPENAWSYELGLKSQWFDDRLRVNLTGFYLDVTDLQTPSAAVSPAGAVNFITQNIADYTNKGFELEVTARPLENLSVYTSIGYQNADYGIDPDEPDFSRYGVKSVSRQQRDCQLQLSQGRIPLGSGASNAADCAVGIIDANGNIAEPVRTPAWSIAVGGTYDFPIPTAGIVISPTVNLVYHSSLETDTSNATIFTGSVTSSFNGQVYPTNPFGGDVITGSFTGSYTLVNAQLALTTDDNNWLVAIECDNCFNETYGQSSLVNFTYFNAPMTWTIRAKRTF